MAGDGLDGMEAVAEELYAIDPGEFVAARNDLVRRLRKEGQRPLAGEVARLRRPSPAAWAVNQLARRHRAEVEELVRLGEALREAQDRALAGAQSADLRQAARARRDGVARLVELAERILAERGVGGDAHAGEVAATLEAASLDAEAAAAVLGGRLTSGLEAPSGFGAFDLPVAERGEAPERSSPSGPSGPEPAERETKAAEHAAAEARRRWEQRSAQARAAVERVAQSRQAVQDAEAEVAKLEDALADAQRRLRAAVRDAEHAEDAAARAEEAAAKAAERLRHAEEQLAHPGGG